jgi:D-aminopeptidase
MAGQKRAADLGIRIGSLAPGPRNRITDVGGVRVGHRSVVGPTHRTGVTAVLPSRDHVFAAKLPAAAWVLNGYGKTLGLVQVAELGNLESPILLTNTLNVGLVHDALVEHALRECAASGIPLRSFNPVVAECNDAGLNDISQRVIGQSEVFAAIADAGEDFEEGGVGAGTGMTCHQLKGGIGSASRVMELEGGPYTLGVLVLSNHGLLRDLRIRGLEVGREIAARLVAREEADRGSIIAVIATDLPVSDRQLGRICRRASVGMARAGSYIGQGSGEIVIAFSTANAERSAQGGDFRQVRVLAEERLDLPFRAAAEATEEAILNSLIAADRVALADGRVRECLREQLDEGMLERIRATGSGS